MVTGDDKAVVEVVGDVAAKCMDEIISYKLSLSKATHEGLAGVEALVRVVGLLRLVVENRRGSGDVAAPVVVVVARRDI